MTLRLCLLAICLYVVATCACTAQQALCSLSAGSTQYSLESLGTLPSKISVLPGGYTGGFINFCAPASGCPEGAYACLISPTLKNITLCKSPPTGNFIFTQSPQVGATFSCSDGQAPLNGLVSSATLSHTHTHIHASVIVSARTSDTAVLTQSCLCEIS